MYQPKPIPRKPPKSPKRPAPARKCPSGFRWDSVQNRCVQAGVGPEYRP
tara:strand:+ start:911 stop:1057 length:147 start_codon:yes stop_codon:yes gene_type:complete